MKAICLLICLALARDISGSIFQYRRPAKNPEVRRYFDESRESVNEKQYRSRKEQLNQQWSDEEQRVYQQPQYQQREDYPQSQYKQRKEYQQPQYKQRKEYQQPQYIYREYSEPQFQNIEYSRFQDKAKNSKHSLNQANLPYPKPSRGYQQHELVFKDKGFNHEQKTVPTVTRYADSVSESKESVSNENIVNLMQFPGADQFAQPRFADMGMASPVYRSMNQDVMFGDAVVWRGIQLAADPKNLVSEKDIKNIYIEAQKTLKHIDPETKNKLHKTLDTAIQANIEDTHLNATELLKKHQYPVEEHTIKTEDGYLLTLFRIPPKQAAGEVKQRPVVFLMHGLLGSADDWLLMGPQKSLAYILWDAGFDVWLGNGRGNRYSKHVSNHREQDEFWQYSNDEIALFDLPAMIDYVLQTSKQEKMVFIAHSLGTTAFFSLAATKPSYNEKIVMMYALAPMAYMGNVRSPMIRMIAPTSPLYERLHKQLGHGEFKPNKDLIHTLGGESCMNEIDCKHLCSNVYAVMTSVNVDHLNTSVIPMILSHLPAGASTKQMMHYGQAVASHEFRMYDYGAEVNQKVYNDIVPPKYDMTAVTAPVALYYSESDWLAHPKDVKRLEKELPNVVDEYKIPQDYFTHMDFQFSNKALEVYEKLIASILQNYSY